MSDVKLHFVTTKSPCANALRNELILHYGNTQPCDATHIVAIGGDGTALSAWHCALQVRQKSQKTTPVYAVDCSDRSGHQGFLTNPELHAIGSLSARIHDAEPMQIHPLQADCKMTGKNQPDTFFGFNEIAVKTNMYGTTRLSVAVFDQEKLINTFSITGDGVLVATPVGASAYYKNAGGRLLAGFGPAFNHMLRVNEKYLSQTNKLGIQTICATPAQNHSIPNTCQVHVLVGDAPFRPTCIMRDDGRVSDPIALAQIFQSRTPIAVLRDKQRD